MLGYICGRYREAASKLIRYAHNDWLPHFEQIFLRLLIAVEASNVVQLEDFILCITYLFKSPGFYDWRSSDNIFHWWPTGVYCRLRLLLLHCRFRNVQSKTMFSWFAKLKGTYKHLTYCFSFSIPITKMQSMTQRYITLHPIITFY